MTTVENHINLTLTDRQQARARVLKSQMKAVEDKRFNCSEHDVAYRDSTRLKRHLNGRKNPPELYLT